jgi:hypothetical protein
MTQPQARQTGPASPDMQVIQMSTAYWASSFVYAAAKLGLADHLVGGAKSAGEIAGAMAVHERSLHRFMRSLACIGLLSDQGNGRFALTELGQTLKTSAASATRATVLTMGSPWFAQSLGNLEYSVRTGRTAFEQLNGLPVFDFLTKRPEDASLFSQTMVGVHGEEPAKVAEAYDFSAFKTVVDVGGATGNLLAAILARHAGVRGILFDLPHVVTDAPALLKARNVLDRVKIESGSFFEGVPSGADAYFLSHIIHDWSEEQCLTILGHCRTAMLPDSKLLIVEMVLPEGDAPHPGKMLDMVMLAIPGGQERTSGEYAELLRKAGFRMTRVVPTQSAVSVVEAVKT